MELLVAMTIIGTLSVVLVSGFGVSLRSNALAEDYTKASFLLRDLMTGLETESELKAGKQEGTFGDDFPAFTWSTEIVKDAAKPFFRVDGKVLFTRRGVTRELTARTVLPEPPPSGDPEGKAGKTEATSAGKVKTTNP